MFKNSSANYFQKTKKDFKKSRERYQDLSGKETFLEKGIR